MSPRSSSQFETMRRQSKKIILEAAMELFATKGFHQTSIEDIRKKANVSKGLIYNYFDKKEDLMKGVVDMLIVESEHWIEPLSGPTDSKSALKKLIDGTLMYLQTNKQKIRLMLALSLQIQDFPELEHIIFEKYRLSLPFFHKLLSDVGIENPEGEALFLIAFMDGIGLQYNILGDSLDLDLVRNSLYDRYNLTTSDHH